MGPIGCPKASVTTILWVYLMYNGGCLSAVVTECCAQKHESLNGSDDDC